MFTINFVNYLLHKLIVKNEHCQIMKMNHLKRKAVSSLIYKMVFYVQKETTYSILLWKWSTGMYVLITQVRNITDAIVLEMCSLRESHSGAEPSGQWRGRRW